MVKKSFLAFQAAGILRYWLSEDQSLAACGGSGPTIPIGVSNIRPPDTRIGVGRTAGTRETCSPETIDLTRIVVRGVPSRLDIPTLQTDLGSQRVGKGMLKQDAEGTIGGAALFRSAQLGEVVTKGENPRPMVRDTPSAVAKGHHRHPSLLVVDRPRVLPSPSDDKLPPVRIKKLIS